MIETLMGITGAGIVMLFFILNQVGSVTTESRVYDFGNALGAFFLFMYAWFLGSLPFMIINFVWFVFSFKDLLTKQRVSGVKEISETEQVISEILPDGPGNSEGRIEGINREDITASEGEVAEMYEDAGEQRVLDGMPAQTDEVEIEPEVYEETEVEPEYETVEEAL